MTGGGWRQQVVAGSHNGGAATASSADGSFAAELLGVLKNTGNDPGNASSSDFSAADDTRPSAAQQTSVTVSQRFYDPETSEAIKCQREAGATVTSAAEAVPNLQPPAAQWPDKCSVENRAGAVPIVDGSIPKDDPGVTSSSDFSAADNNRSPAQQTFATVPQRFYDSGKWAGVASPPEYVAVEVDRSTPKNGPGTTRSSDFSAVDNNPSPAWSVAPGPGSIAIDQQTFAGVPQRFYDPGKWAGVASPPEYVTVEVDRSTPKDDPGITSSSDFSAAEDNPSPVWLVAHGPSPVAASQQTFATVPQRFHDPEIPAGVALLPRGVAGEPIECQRENAGAILTVAKEAVADSQTAAGGWPLNFPGEDRVSSIPIADFSTGDGGESARAATMTLRKLPTNLPATRPRTLPVSQRPAPATAQQHTPLGPPRDQQKMQGHANPSPPPGLADTRVVPTLPRSADVLLGVSKDSGFSANLPGIDATSAQALPHPQQMAKSSSQQTRTAIPVVTEPDVAALFPPGQGNAADPVARQTNFATGQPESGLHALGLAQSAIPVNVGSTDAGPIVSMAAAATLPQPIEAVRSAPSAPPSDTLISTPVVTTAVASPCDRGAAVIAPASQSQPNRQWAMPEEPSEDSVPAFEARLTASQPAAAPRERIPGNGIPAAPVPAQAITANLRPNGPSGARDPGMAVSSATGGEQTRTTNEPAVGHATASVGSVQKRHLQLENADPLPERPPSAAGNVTLEASAGDFSKADFREAAASAPEASSGARAEFPGEPARERAESAAQPLREISIRITSDTQAADVRMTERNGTIQVAVRASDANLAHSLRSDVGDLVRGLSPSGLNAEVWQPGSGSQTPDGGSSKRESGSEGFIQRQDKQDSQQSGNHQRKDERRQSGQSADELE